MEGGEEDRGKGGREGGESVRVRADAKVEDGREGERERESKRARNHTPCPPSPSPATSGTDELDC